MEYDPDADALYVYLRRFAHVARTNAQPDRSRSIDYDADGEPLGVEFWNVSSGLHLDGIPERGTVERLIEHHPFRVYAA
jgi:uncharacterized protein YuzE